MRPLVLLRPIYSRNLHTSIIYLTDKKNNQIVPKSVKLKNALVKAKDGTIWTVRHPIQAKNAAKKVINSHLIVPMKLMYLDVKLARKIFKQRKLENRTEFTPLEKRKLSAIFSDLLRFGPYMFFIIIPALELLLPLYLMMFPQAKPGWFETRDARDKKLRQKLATKVEMGKLLAGALEMYQTKKDNSSLTAFKALAKKMNDPELRKEVKIEELQKYVPLFNTTLSVDKLSTEELAAMCKLLLISTPVGIKSSEYWLKYVLTQKMTKLRKEDEQIRLIGLTNLTNDDLIKINAARGGRSTGMTRQKLEEEINFWIQMNFEYQLPISLTLYMRAIHILPYDKVIKKKAEEVEKKKTEKKEEPISDEISKPYAYIEQGIQELGTLDMIQLKEIILSSKRLLQLYEALEEVNDMILVRDIDDDIHTFAQMLRFEEDSFETSTSKRTKNLKNKLAKISKSIEKDKKKLEMPEVSADKTLSDSLEPKVTDEDGHILNDDMKAILSRILVDRDYWNDSMLDFVIKAFNPNKNKKGIEIAKLRRTIRAYLPDKKEKDSQDFIIDRPRCNLQQICNAMDEDSDVNKEDKEKKK